MRVTTRIIVPVLCLITVLMTAPLWAAEESASELAKKTQNPVADLISVPLQNNFNFSAGPNDATIYVLNVQPVIPLKLTEDWNLITRTIMPIINQPSLFPGTTAPSGWGTSIPRSSCPRRSPASSSGGGADVHPADGDRLAAGHEPVEHGAGGRGAEHARPLGLRRARQPAVVVRRLGRPGCERDADPAVRELQPAGRLVPGERPHHHGELGGQQWRYVDRAGGWGWGSCSSWTSCRSIPSCRPSTTWSGPSSRQTGSCASSCSFSSPSRSGHGVRGMASTPRRRSSASDDSKVRISWRILISKPSGLMRLSTVKRWHSHRATRQNILAV